MVYTYFIFKIRKENCLITGRKPIKPTMLLYVYIKKIYAYFYETY